MLNEKYSSFRNRITESAQGKKIPLTVMFELTYRCNFACKHCYLPNSYRKNYGELESKEIFAILEQLKDSGCFYLGFTGGELFVRQDAIDILRYAKKCGFETTIYSNGSLIDKKLADELAILNPSAVEITIHSLKEKSFERITGIKGSWKKVFNAVHLLHQRKVNLGFKACVLKENQNETKQIFSFAASLGARCRFDHTLFPRLNGSKAPYRYRGGIKLSKTDILQMKRYLNVQNWKDCDFRQKKGNEVLSDIFSCAIGKSHAAITPLGEIKLCVMIERYKYRILDSSLIDGWSRLIKKAEDIKPDKNYRCKECDLRNFCRWCPATSWLNSRDFTSCEPIYRKKIEFIIKNMKA